MKTATCYLLIGCLMAAAANAPAQSPVAVTIDAQKPGLEIPADFAGISIFTGTQVANHRGMPGNLFSGTNVEMITLFKNSGIHHVRLGATGSSTSGGQNLVHADIDALFAFAKATGIRVIYSLHGNGAAETAKYVWDHYRPWLDCFAFDNEPDKRAGNDAQDGIKATAGKNYFADWRSVAQSVLAAVPEAKFAGPDAAGRTLTARFLRHEKGLGCIKLATQHTYVGGNSVKKKVDQSHAIDAMLSRNWPDKQYPALYRQALESAVKHNLPYRITELNDYVHGVPGASDAFASALWVLDCLHWWAVQGAAGINFQNTEWIPTDTFYIDTNGDYQMRPKSYGIRAFDLGSHGAVDPVAIQNADGINLTAYAVGSTTNLFVTVINKEHGPEGKDAVVTVAPDGFTVEKAQVMFLQAPDNNPGAQKGVTLGGQPISNNQEWHGQWTPLAPTKDNSSVLRVAKSSAAVICLTGKIAH